MTKDLPLGAATVFKSSYEEWKHLNCNGSSFVASSLKSSYEEWKPTCGSAVPDFKQRVLNFPTRNGNKAILDVLWLLFESLKSSYEEWKLSRKCRAFTCPLVLNLRRVSLWFI